jgi:hypothetical protein
MKNDMGDVDRIDLTQPFLVVQIQRKTPIENQSSDQ